MQRCVGVFGLGLLLALVACDVDCAPSVEIAVAEPAPAPASAPAPAAGAEPKACLGPPHAGTTSCFPGECSVGHWCDDAAAQACRPGCTSDENCGPRDLCVREGDAAVGRCEPCIGRPTHEPAPGCVVPSRSGTTKCFPDCPAGQHCVDEGTEHCEPGCASDENCGPSEHCMRAPSSPLGVCRSCYYD